MKWAARVLQGMYHRSSAGTRVLVVAKSTRGKSTPCPPSPPKACGTRAATPRHARNTGLGGRGVLQGPPPETLQREAPGDRAPPSVRPRAATPRAAGTRAWLTGCAPGNPVTPYGGRSYEYACMVAPCVHFKPNYELRIDYCCLRETNQWVEPPTVVPPATGFHRLRLRGPNHSGARRQAGPVAT